MWAGHNETLGVWNSTTCPNTTEGHNYLVQVRMVDYYKGARPHASSTSQANMINGTDGTSFHPFVKEDDTLYVFSEDLLRSEPPMIRFTPG